ncbi:Iron-sulfur assembly protein 1 [Spathaspora sp. JA1]|nr:Iron-sulfur assembly protein 1 [Spathaspora sp. JA1]
MIATRSTVTLRRFISNHAKKNKRFIQTIPLSVSTVTNNTTLLNSLGQQTSSKLQIQKQPSQKQDQPQETHTQAPQQHQPVARRSRTSRFTNNTLKEITTSHPKVAAPQSPPHVIEITTDPEVKAAIESTKANQTTTPSTSTAIPNVATPTVTTTAPKKKRVLRPRMALITLSPNAVSHLQKLLDQPTPKMIRIGVRNRGCSGLTYNLEYVEQAGKFDELIEQDGVKVLIDSKALFSIVGSEMDWLDDKLSSRFIFKNPNSKGTCGCGESFMV